MSRADHYFSSQQLRADLKGKTVRGGLYTAVSQMLVVLINLAAIPILARLLSPSDFGLVAMVSVFTGLAAMFVDAGLTMATVQREELTHQQVTNLFWLATALGLLIALFVAAASPLLAWFYDEPRLIAITIAMSAATFFSGLTIQHQALLRRAMQLWQLGLIQVGCTLLGNVLTIAIAWQLRSYWALVALPVLVAALRMAGVWAACRWRPGLPRRGAGVGRMIGFGANLTGFNFINYFARSGDKMLIGWSWGAAALGHYERAYMVMMAPLRQINAPLAGVMIPALSRLQSQPDRYRDAYLAALAVFQLVSCPLMAVVIVMAPSVVRVAFGSEYGDAGPLLRWLAVAGFLQPLTNSLGWLYISQGRGGDLMRWGLLGSSLIVLSFIVGLPWGPLGVARAYAGMICLVVAPLAVWFAGQRGPVTRSDLARACGAAILMAVPAASAALLVAYVLRPGSPLLTLALAMCASLAATALLLWSTKLGSGLLEQLKDIVRQAMRSGVENTPAVS